MWKLINSLISSKEKSLCPPEKLFDPIKSNNTNNPEVMSNIFNTYFVSIGQQLASKIPPPLHHTYPVKVNGPKNSFGPDTFAEEVNMVINNLLVFKNNRQNDVPTHILKLCKNSLSFFLVQIFNLCIKEGTYPQSSNCAQVVPIYKGDPKDLCTNYRPISLLSPIDTIDHVLLWKLDNCFGIRALPLKLLASYLQGRQQYTVIGGCTSSTLNITKGSLRAHRLASCYLHFILMIYH